MLYCSINGFTFQVRKQIVQKLSFFHFWIMVHDTIYQNTCETHLYPLLGHALGPSAVFQALVNDVFRKVLNKYIFVYLDDILISRKPGRKVYPLITLSK